MPHILTRKHEDISLLNNKNGVTFNFIAKNKFEDKISVSVADKTFLLTKLIKNDKHLIKIDQATRVTPISMAKKALDTYAKICNSEVLFSNTAHSETKLEVKKEFIKDISFFVNDFKTNKEICVEVGFGSGRHLIHQAQQNPQTIYIGIEIHTASIEKMLKQVKLLNITNILAVNYDARLFLEFLSSNSVSRVFVHFPVPWDKKPHRRVMSVEFITECLRTLKNNGSLELRTDSPKYYEYSKDLLNNFSNYKSEIFKNQSLEVSSKYEDRWKKMGKDIWDITIYSNENSKELVINKDFNFYLDFRIDFQKMRNNIVEEAIVKEDYFIHFSKFYIANENLALLSLTMGSFTKPLSIYLILTNEKISYYCNTPIPTSSNQKAHLLINAKLNELLK